MDKPEISLFKKLSKSIFFNPSNKKKTVPIKSWCCFFCTETQEIAIVKLSPT